MYKSGQNIYKTEKKRLTMYDRERYLYFSSFSFLHSDSFAVKNGQGLTKWIELVLNWGGVVYSLPSDGEVS